MMDETTLVLSLFPGIGLLDMAFEEEGFCVVRGPDVLWGGDVKRFHPPAGVFTGIIGGPPCQLFSALRHLNPLAGTKHGNLIPEFERVVSEARPAWFLMENVPDAPEPQIDGYIARSVVINNRWLGEAQERVRRFSFGTPNGLTLTRHLAEQMLALPLAGTYSQAVTSSSRRVSVKIGGSGKVKRTYTEDGKRHGPGVGERTPIAEMCELQGLPTDYLSEAPFSETGKRKMIGNGVPLPMGRAIAQAVRAAHGRAIGETK
jgi:DNA (cytosine-5)-methyltransferase 1